jgi:hypothetical protein
MVNVPQRYVPKNLTKDDFNKQKKELKKSRKQYKKGKYYTRKKVKSFKSKISPHILKTMKMYNVKKVKPSRKLAKATKCKIKGLKEMFRKGQGAYYSSGSRPNQTGHSWGYARMASAITGGKASAVDFHIIKKYCSKKSKAYKLAKKAMKKYNKGTRRVKKVKIGGRTRKHIKKSKPTKKNGKLYFKDHPEFTPNLTPKEMFQLGSFGGTYWRPIKSKFHKNILKNKHKKYPKTWWKDLHDSWLTTPMDKYDKKINKYGVRVGTTLQFWEMKKWINKSHPYGWVQWYCDFYMGKRGDDDERQIKRWSGLAGPKGRFRKWLITIILKGKNDWDNYDISPKIRQTLQHWGYKLTKGDFNKEVKSRDN